MPQVIAKARYIRIAPRKVRVLADVVRGMKAEEALNQLRFIPKGASGPMEKLLRSAIANAEHNFSLDRGSLKIVKVAVDGGPVLKRFRPRAFGRAVPIRRRTSHITVILEGRSAVKTEKRKTKTELVPRLEKTKEPEDKIADKEQPEFKVEKSVGKERKASLVRRLFRRKSI